MRDVLDFVKRHSLLALAILVGAVVVIVLLALAGASFWQSLLSLFGLGASGGAALKTYAQKDAKRQAEQAEVERLRQKQLAELEAERQEREEAARLKAQRENAEIQRAAAEDDPEKLREDLLKDVRGGPYDA